VPEALASHCRTSGRAMSQVSLDAHVRSSPKAPPGGPAGVSHEAFHRSPLGGRRNEATRRRCYPLSARPPAGVREVRLRILVVRLSSLGDIARMLPSLRRFGGASLLPVRPDRRGPVPAPPAHLSQFGPPPGLPRRGPGACSEIPGDFMTRWENTSRPCAPGGTTFPLTSTASSVRAGGARLGGARHGRLREGFGKEGSHLLYHLPRCRRRAAHLQAGALRRNLEVLGFRAVDPSYLEPELPSDTVGDRDRFLAGAGLAPGGYALLFVGTSRAQSTSAGP